MAVNLKPMPDTPERQRLLVACQCVRDEARRQGIEERELAKRIDRDSSTISRLLTGKHVSDTTWYRVGKEFGWGRWLDFVRQGDIPEAEDHGDVDPLIRDWALKRLRQIENTNRIE